MIRMQRIFADYFQNIFYYYLSQMEFMKLSKYQMVKISEICETIRENLREIKTLRFMIRPL